MSKEGANEINTKWLSTDHLEGEMIRRTAAGGAIAMLTQVLRILIQVGGIATLARLLVPADFGLVAMAATVTGFVSLFSEIGLSTATIQKRDISQRVVSTLFYLGIVVSVFVMLVAIALAFAAAAFYDDSRVAYLAIGMALALPISAGGAQHNALLARGMRWVSINTITLSGQMAGTVIAILLAWLTPLSYWALVFQTISAAVFSTFLQWHLCSWRPSIEFNLKEAREEIGFGLNLTGFSIANYFHRQADNVLIGRRWGEVELGFYTRAYSIMLIPMGVVNGAIGSVVMPLLSRHQDRPDQWRQYFIQALTITCFACHAIAVVLVSNSENIIAVMLGTKWMYSVAIFRYLGLSLFAMAPMSSMGWVFMSLGQTDRWFRWGLFTMVYFPAAFLIGLPYRSEGVAALYAAAVTIVAVPCISYSIRFSPITLRQILLTLRAPFIASVGALFAMSGCNIYLRYLDPVAGLIIGIAASAFIYFVLSSMLIALDRQQQPQRDVILKLVRRVKG